MESGQVCLNCSKVDAEDTTSFHTSPSERDLETTQAVMEHDNNTASEVDLVDISPAEVDLVDISPAEVDLVDISPAEVDLVDISPAEVDLVDISPAEVDLVDISPSNITQKQSEIIVKPLNVSNYYSELCSCGEIKNHCRCSHGNFSIWERFLPRNAHYWPKLKLSILICLGSIPWIFILIYLLFYIL